MESRNRQQMHPHFRWSFKISTDLHFLIVGVAFGSFVILDKLFDDPSPFWWPASSFPQRRFGAWTGGNSSGASSACQSSQPRFLAPATEIISRPNRDMKRRKFAGRLMTGSPEK